MATEDSFYNSVEWLAVREQALARDSHRCTVARHDPSGRFLASPALERFMAKIDVVLDPCLAERGIVGECWIWNASLQPEGYSQFWHDGKQGTGHHFAYEHFVGPVPEGYEIDHLCRNRACVNPQHLEAVTRRENILRGDSPAAHNARKAHCKRGHPLSGDNLYELPSGSRICRECSREDGRMRSRDEEPHRFYNSAAWRTVRAEVLARDEYRCTASRWFGGECQGGLQVHHIISRKLRPDLALDPENLGTACRSHHQTWEVAARTLRAIEAGEIPPCRCRGGHRYAAGHEECRRRREDAFLWKRLGSRARRNARERAVA